jgi:Domain of unknown function (DUF4169)
MGEVINLRLARKAKIRAEGGKAAEAARAKSGESKSVKRARKREAQRAARQLDGAKREPE